MTAEQAKSIVLAKFPAARCVPVYSLCANLYRHVVVDGTSFQGKWLSGKHHTENAAWLKAAKVLARPSCY